VENFIEQLERIGLLNVKNLMENTREKPMMWRNLFINKMEKTKK